MSTRVINKTKKRKSGRLYQKKPVKLTPAGQRRLALQNAREDAEKQFPKLNDMIARQAETVRSLPEDDRFAYEGILIEIFAKLHKWKKKDLLDSRKKQIAALRGKTLRKDSTAARELIGAIFDRTKLEKSAASRWVKKLNTGLMENYSELRFAKSFSKGRRITVTTRAAG